MGNKVIGSRNKPCKIRSFENLQLVNFVDFISHYKCSVFCKFVNFVDFVKFEPFEIFENIKKAIVNFIMNQIHTYVPTCGYRLSKNFKIICENFEDHY